jgi:hypothetical protein
MATDGAQRKLLTRCLNVLRPGPFPNARPGYPLISAGWFAALLLLAAVIAIIWFYAALYDDGPTDTTHLAMAVISAVVPWLGAIAGVRFRRPALGVVSGSLLSFGLCALLLMVHNAYCDGSHRIRGDEFFWRTLIAAHVALGFALTLLARQVHRRLSTDQPPTVAAVLRIAAIEGAKTVAAAGLIIAFSFGGVLAMVARAPQRPMDYLGAIGIWAAFVVAGAVLGAVIGTILAVCLAAVAPVLPKRPATIASWLPLRASSALLAALFVCVAVAAALRAKPYVLNYLAISALFDDTTSEDWGLMGQPNRGPFAKFMARELSVVIDSESKADSMAHIGSLLEPAAIFIRTESVGNEHLATLAPLKELFWLHIESPAVSDAGLAHLKNLESLSSFSARGTQITGAGLRDLRLMTKIDELGLSENPIDDAGLRSLAGASALFRLDLSHTRITDEGLSSLAACIKLDTLNLAHTLARGKALVSLPSRNVIRYLDLSHSQVDDQSIHYIAALPGLVHLDLSNTKLTDSAAIHFRNFNLVTLNVSKTQFGDRMIEKLTYMPDLWDVTLDDTSVTGKTAALLEYCRRLHRISLARTPFSDDGVAGLAKSQTIAKLDLSGTRVTDACIPHLKKMPALSEVYLRGTKVSPAGKRAVWDILQDKWDTPQGKDALPPD